MKVAYRAAIIGCGRIGGGYGEEGTSASVACHASAYRIEDRISLIAAADRDVVTRDRMGRRWGIESLYVDHRDLLHAHQIDILSVCTPDETHAQIVRDAVDAGVKVVLCEKPLAPTVEEAKEIALYCEKFGCELFVGYQRRWEPAHRMVRKAVKDGRFGDIIAVNGYYVGGLRHNGCAWINLVRFLVGELSDVRPIGSLNVDRDVSRVGLSIEFACGAEGSLLAGDRNAYSLFEIDIIGTEGRLRLSDAGSEIEAWTVKEDLRYPGFRRLVRSKPFWPSPEIHQGLNWCVTGIADFLEGKAENPSPGTDAAVDMEWVDLALAQRDE